MGLSRIFLPAGLSVLLISLAVPAQRKTGGTARLAQPAVASINIETINLDGLKTLITKQKDRPLLVNFWATWCIPCRDEFPDLVKIDAEFRPRGLDFVTVSLDDVGDIKTEVPKFLTGMKATMPAYLLDVKDPEPAINAVDPKWQGDLPATFLYNEKGEVAFKHFGRVDTTALREAIQKLVKK
jgi:thiol-disulfide isomerase/thioredoxin